MGSLFVDPFFFLFNPLLRLGSNQSSIFSRTSFAELSFSRIYSQNPIFLPLWQNALPKLKNYNTFALFSHSSLGSDLHLLFSQWSHPKSFNHDIKDTHISIKGIINVPWGHAQASSDQVLSASGRGWLATWRPCRPTGSRYPTREDSAPAGSSPATHDRRSERAPRPGPAPPPPGQALPRSPRPPAAVRRPSRGAPLYNQSREALSPFEGQKWKRATVNWAQREQHRRA